jgi:alpha-L-fucosidase
MRDDFIPLFQARDYEPDEIVRLAREAGMKYVVPFCKHHSGFCLWPSSYTRRNAFDMGPNRDLIEPVVRKCKEEGLKFGFYFSVDEWEYPIIDPNGEIVPHIWSSDVTPTMGELEYRASGKIAVRNFAEDYLVPQAVEFIDKYDPDILWYDGEWLTEAVDLKTYDIAAYFYNQADGRKEVAVNDRYGTKDGKRLRSVHGDFYTSEYHKMGDEDKRSVHPWEECRGISQSYGFNWQDTESNVLSPKELIDMFVNIVANGGNLLLMVNLDGQGALPEVQERRLREMGKWLAVNGEGIYSTRPFDVRTEGSVYYTRSKDGQTIFAVLKEWPGNETLLKSITQEEIEEITMLGSKETLHWEKADGGVLINFPKSLQNNRPCEYAWVLKIKKL